MDTDDNQRSIANFAALKTAIVNGEELRVKALLPKDAMVAIEKSYLIDLAYLNKHSAIIKLIEAIPVKK